MTDRRLRWLVWCPRILATVFCLFLSLFALDATGNTEFAFHIVPTLLLLAVVAVSFQWEWVGGIVFTVLGLAYAYIARDHVSWVLSISVPLIVVGLLYVVSWRHHRELHAPA